MIQSPKHVLRAITAKTQVDGLERHKVFFPYLQTNFFIFIIVRDRIAYHQQIELPLAHQAYFFRLAGEPPIGDPRRRVDRLVLRRRRCRFNLRLDAMCRRAQKDGQGETHAQAHANDSQVSSNIHNQFSLSIYV